MKIKKRGIILIIALLAGVFALGFYTYSQATDHFDSLEQTIAQKQFELNQLLDDIDKNQEYVEKWNSINSFMNETPGDRLTAYGDYIITLETERNFDLQTTTEEKAIPDSKEMQEIIFKLEFVSNLSDLAEFLARLDNEQNKLLQIKTMTINYRGKATRSAFATTDKADDKELSVTLTLATPARVAPKTGDTTVFPTTLLP